mmetsp:Transcript_129829/g.323564  ORF Transcript_129829/g.323564 Transcript_129829/m.323564 type:complete len:270 (-) Transcript_129829:2069-2878(-)
MNRRSRRLLPTSLLRIRHSARSSMLSMSFPQLLPQTMPSAALLLFSATSTTSQRRSMRRNSARVAQPLPRTPPTSVLMLLPVTPTLSQRRRRRMRGRKQQRRRRRSMIMTLARLELPMHQTCPCPDLRARPHPKPHQTSSSNSSSNSSSSSSNSNSGSSSRKNPQSIVGNSCGSKPGQIYRRSCCIPLARRLGHSLYYLAACRASQAPRRTTMSSSWMPRGQPTSPLLGWCRHLHRMARHCWGSRARLRLTRGEQARSIKVGPDRGAAS